jgi:alpha/beta superfamily hydrolase
MVEIDQIFIANNELKIEAELFQSTPNVSKLVVLICHPHPQYGGNMFNNIVSGIFNKLVQNGISCLRFNFRGVGKSTGSHSNGSGELSDVHACINFLINEKNFEKVMLCGYSYGAAIGCSAVKYSEKIIGFISVSYPWGFMGSRYKNMSQTAKYKLFIQGNRDSIARYDSFQINFESYSDPKQFKIIEGADHFYWGFEEQVADEVLAFIKNL